MPTESTAKPPPALAASAVPAAALRSFNPMTRRPPPTVKCLIVDDLEENILALSALLRRDDVELLTARSGPDALEVLLRNDVALAILDVQMPEMDGFQLAELMRGIERTRHVPLIFVTAGNQDEHRQFKGYESGAVDFLYKPVSPQILKNKAEVFFQLGRQKLQLAQELQERTEALRMNELFMAVLGHDLRNPLHSIMVAAQLLQRAGDGANLQQIGERIRSGGRSMQRMIDDMLDMARTRLDRGFALQLEAVDLGAIVERIESEYRSALPSRKIGIVRLGDLNGCWDPERLMRVAWNLIGNALRHGDDGHPITILLDGRDADSVVFTISNGGAIAPELLPHIFDPFRQDDQQGKEGGLGLGLYIVRQIVEAHGGSIDVSSDRHEGTTFRVQLPRAT